MMPIPAMKKMNLPLRLLKHHRLSSHPWTLGTRKHKALRAALHQFLKDDLLQGLKVDPFQGLKVDSHQIPLHWLAMLPRYEQNI
jgi:hypothetical protein